ncbi:hypothetical protein [Luteimonas changyuni]|uniref:hypothetical protein n=1 Tax=Luteimonas sp. MJ145 TaxID=3129234 RepID=UPI0031BADF75
MAHLRKEFRLDWNGIHGAAHWARVRFHGVSLARGLGLDERVPALDLGRVGIRPDPRRLCTPLARDAGRIERAWRWSLR